jgi:catechol 2,3-dioxygenase-like lactoylglutathione lyase family enzyme
MNAIGIVVSDMDAAIAFYAELGLDLTSTPGDHLS